VALRVSSEAEISELLAFYPVPIARLAQELRRVVRRAAPTAVERVRPGWGLIGYDLPITRNGTYFAWIWPENEHVHVGWQVGTLMADPRGLLRGAHLKLKKVRYLTYAPGDVIDAEHVVEFTRDAARIASMSRDERQLLALSRSA